MKIRTSIIANGCYEILLDEIETDSQMVTRCSELIKHFVKGDELFFGLYREDGYWLDKEEVIRFREEIPQYFQNNGRWFSLFDKNNKFSKKNFDYRIHKLGSLPANNTTYKMLPHIFHYFLETICFCPKVDWKTFQLAYSHYMEDGARNYVVKGYTDFLFTYVDSGDFRISFDPTIYEPNTVYGELIQVLYPTNVRME